ncbi:MAG TPA: energy transducer TonB [Bryobacteraceae bacterium]|nr:energy transducer TonB [Bryobacteraceae bacterium]
MRAARVRSANDRKYSGVHAGEIFGGKLIRYVRPEYPRWAKRRGIQGVVEFTAVVGKDGTIERLTLLKGPKELVPYAEAAIRQWRYEPILLNGVPLETITDEAVDFTLNQ